MNPSINPWRHDFPALEKGVYLDSAATAHKPRRVIDKMSQLMGADYATVSRGLYTSSQNMTAAYESARNIFAQFINAQNNEIVFTRNATEAINIVARGLCQSGDHVTITEMEHHANIVPWQLVGAQIRILPITESGEINMNAFEKFVSPQTKILAFTAASNVLGTINSVAQIVASARRINPNIITIVDATQAAAHGPVDMKAWDCDFAAFTGHKLYGPTGVGLLYGKAEQLNQLPPFLGGGDMIEEVTFVHTTYREPPHKFEAGTPNFIEAIGLAEAILYLQEIGWEKIAAHENIIKETLLAALRSLETIEIVGSAHDRLALASFTMSGCHPHDAAMILNEMNIMVRVGHHCAMPLLARLGQTSLIRASAALYTNKEDIYALRDGLDKAHRMLT